MTFRQEVDRRLNLISESNLTDEEYATLTVPASPTTTNYYEAAEEILDLRGSIGNTKARLNALALALDDLIYNASEVVSSNIFIGADLES